MKYPNADRLKPDATDTEKAVHELAIAIIANMPNPPIYLKSLPCGPMIKPTGRVSTRSLARLADEDRGKEVGFIIDFTPPDKFATRGIIGLYARCIGRCVGQDWMLHHRQDLLAVDWSKPPSDIVAVCGSVLSVLDALPRFVAALQAEVAKGPPPPVTTPASSPPPASLAH